MRCTIIASPHLRRTARAQAREVTRCTIDRVTALAPRRARAQVRGSDFHHVTELTPRYLISRKILASRALAC
jgi:hypothetical protein